MTRLWRYWPVRGLCILGAGWATILLLVFAIYNARIVAVLPFCVVLILLVALAAGTGALVAKLERIPRIAPADAGRLSGPALFGAVMGLVALGAIAPVATGMYEGQLTPPSFLARGFIALFAIFLPFWTAAHARPRSRRHWVVLALCIPAMYIASLASLPAAALIGSAVFPGDPGAVKVHAVLGLTLLVLNALPVAMVVESGACPLKLDPARPETHGPSLRGA